MKQFNNEVKGLLCLPITDNTEKTIGDVGKLEATVIKNGLVFMKSKMTAIEVLETLEGLEEVLVEMYYTIINAAGACENAKYQMETEDAVSIKLPGFILEEAGIPKGAKLCAYTNEESGEVTVMESEYKHDLSDVSAETLNTLKNMDVSLLGLNECLMSEKIIYGK